MFKCTGKKLNGEPCGKNALENEMLLCEKHYKKVLEVENRKATITITFSEAVENHKGMEIIGEKAIEGFTCNDLRVYMAFFQSKGLVCEYHNLVDYLASCETTTMQPIQEAAILIIRNCLPVFNVDYLQLWKEIHELTWDQKAFMYGRVVDKNARHNLCFADFSRAPNYNEGMGTIIDFKSLPLLSEYRKKLHEYLGDKASNLYAEGNLYYNYKTCGIGAHGDSERSKVVALRLGESIPIQFHWFHRYNKIGRCFNAMINKGDMYIMSAKTVGNDWKKSSIPTLRHCAGAEKYLFE